jgi:hypothetical protein
MIAAGLDPSDLKPAEAPESSRTLELVLKAVPYPHLITDIDLHTQSDVLRFSWRGARYRVGLHLDCEEIQHGCLAGSDLAILMRRVLQLTDTALRNDRLVVPA